MNIEDVLRGAEVLCGEYDDYDLDAATRRLADRVADRVRNDPSQWLLQAEPPNEFHPDAGRTAQRAMDDLEALTPLVIDDAQARRRLHTFARGPHHDPVGARTFGCLLYLLDRVQPARFWWKYAAGAGDPVAAYFLYLHHLVAGMYKDARHWHRVVWLSGFHPDTEWGGRPAGPAAETRIDPEVENHITVVRDQVHGAIHLPAPDLPYEVAQCP